jgi:hypothetical protein
LNQKKGEVAMLKKLLVSVLSFGIIVPLAAADQDLLASFDGGIGVHPVSNVSGAVNADGTFPNVTRNVVRGINPAGQVWVIDRLRANVGLDGHITVDGRGLVLAGGDNAGRTSGQSVFATLICETAAPFTQHNTTVTGILLAPNGDFRIDDVLSAAPSTCPSPMLLIRSAGTGNAWFAVGILKQ